MLDIRHTVGHGDAFEGAGVRLPSGREHSAAARIQPQQRSVHMHSTSVCNLLYRQLNAKRRLGRSSKRNARV